MPATTAASTTPSTHSTTLTHDALLYDSPDAYIAGLVPFLVDGLTAGEPVLVAVPPSNADLLRDALGELASQVVFIDMTDVGRNPACIIPMVRSFVDDHADQHIRFIGEPIWAGRTPEEICEATRHEAMLNTAFAEASVHIRCPYDVSRLTDDVIADCWRTHPTVLTDEGQITSDSYADPAALYRPDDPLPAPPADAESVAVVANRLTSVRQRIRSFASDAGLTPSRTSDLVLAANEIATNTLVHTDADGTLRLWRTDLGVVCEVSDSGHIDDPFAGRESPDQQSGHGRGLWMANHLCDLVQIRSSASGSVIRLQVNHSSRPPRSIGH